MKTRRLLFLALAFCLCLTGCGGKSTPDDTEGALSIYASIHPIADLTQKIGGNQVTVTCLVPPGGEAHDYEPTAKDMTELLKADAFFYNGLHMEGFIDSLKANVSIPFEEISAGVATEEESNDPHVWLSPRRAKRQLENIKDALCRLDPDNKSNYEEQYAVHAKKCDELDRQYQALSGKTILVTHSAYGYLAKDYGLTMIAVDAQGDGDPSPARMEEMIKTCRSLGLKTVYYEEGGSDKIAAAIAAETGCRVAALNAFESTKSGKTDYFAVMEQNYNTILEG